MGCRLLAARVAQKKNPPRVTSGGNGKPFLGGYDASTVEQTVTGTPTNDCWSCGDRRRIGLSPADMGWKKTMTPGDVQTCFAVVYEVWEVPPRRSRVTHSPGASLHPARMARRCVRPYAEPDHPSDHVDETFGIPSTNLTTPSVLLQRGSRLGFGKAGSPTN